MMGMNEAILARDTQSAAIKQTQKQQQQHERDQLTSVGNTQAKEAVDASGMPKHTGSSAHHDESVRHHAATATTSHLPATHKDQTREHQPSNSSGVVTSVLDRSERYLEHEGHKKTTADGGERLVQDLTQAVKDAKLFMEEKRLEESARVIVDHSKGAADKTHRPDLSDATMPNKEELAEDASDVAGQIRRLARLTASSPSFRKFLFDFYQLSRDTFAPRLDQAVAGKLGGNNTESGNFTNQQNEAGFMNAPAYGTTNEIDSRRMQPGHFAQPQMQAMQNTSSEFDSRMPQSQQSYLGGEEHQQAQVDPRLPLATHNVNVRHEVGSQSQQQQQSHQSQQLYGSQQPSGTLNSQHVGGFDQRMQAMSAQQGYPSDIHHASATQQMQPGTYQQTASQQHRDSAHNADLSEQMNVSGEVKNARNQAANARDKVLNTMPREQRQALVQRWREMIEEIKQDDRLSSAIRELRDTVMSLKDKYTPVVEKNHAVAKDLARDQNQQFGNVRDERVAVQRESKALLERMAGGKSLDALIAVIREWFTATREDQELRQWMNDLYAFFDVTVHQPSKLQQDGHVDQLDDFIVRGQEIYEGRHQQLAQRLLRESRDFLEALNNDETSMRLRKSVDTIIKDLFISDKGEIVLKPDVYVQLGKVIRPIMNEMLSDVQIAEVQDRNEDIHFCLANIALDANDLAPDHFTVSNATEASVGKNVAPGGAEFQNTFRISSSGSTCKLRDVAFYYKKFKFPRMSDSGYVDADLLGSGLSFDVDIEFKTNGQGFLDMGRPTAGDPPRDRRDNDSRRNANFRVKNCHVALDKIKLDFRETKHELLYKIFKPIITSRLTKEVSRAVEDQIYRLVDEMDKAAVRARKQASHTFSETAGDRIMRGTDAVNAAHHTHSSAEIKNTPMSRHDNVHDENRVSHDSKTASTPSSADSQSGMPADRRTYHEQIRDHHDSRMKSGEQNQPQHHHHEKLYPQEVDVERLNVERQPMSNAPDQQRYDSSGNAGAGQQYQQQFDRHTGSAQQYEQRNDAGRRTEPAQQYHQTQYDAARNPEVGQNFGQQQFDGSRHPGVGQKYEQYHTSGNMDAAQQYQQQQQHYDAARNPKVDQDYEQQQQFDAGRPTGIAQQYQQQPYNASRNVDQQYQQGFDQKRF